MAIGKVRDAVESVGDAEMILVLACSHSCELGNLRHDGAEVNCAVRCGLIAGMRLLVAASPLDRCVVKLTPVF